MIASVLASDWVKMKRTWIRALAIIGPLGVILLQMVNYLVRYDYLVQPGVDPWPDLAANVHMLMVLAMLLGTTLLASFLSGMEHQGHTWKHLLALPVPRFRIYLGKFLWLALLLLFACALTLAGTIGLGFLLKFSAPPYELLALDIFATYLAAWPVMALQLWLSTVMANQALPIMIGVVGSLFSMAAAQTSSLLPWGYPMQFMALHPESDPWQWALTGLGVGVAVVLAGAFDFVRRDVK